MKTRLRNLSALALVLVLACGETKSERDAQITDADVTDDTGVPSDTFVPEGYVDPAGGEETVALPDTVSKDEADALVDTPIEDVPLEVAGTMTCEEILFCAFGPPCSMRQACVQQCVASGSQQAQGQFLDLWNCGNTNCSRSEDKPTARSYCFLSECREFGETCLGDGDQTCGQFASCIGQCGEGNNQCVVECVKWVSYEGLLRFLALGACAEEQCPSWEQACLQARCGQQWDACLLHGAGSGTGTCVDITDCITEQNCQTEACYQMCLAKGTPEAQQQFVALVRCGNQKCGQYGDDKPMQRAYCVSSQCREFAEPCAKTGTSTCMQVLQCAQGCGQNDEACQQGCIQQASYDALLKILAIAACAEQNCPDMNETCMMTRCMQQIMACTSG